MKKLIFFVVSTCIAVALSVPVSFAAKENPASSGLPDLTINSVVFTQKPKNGDLISPIKIMIENIGNNDSLECVLKLESVASDCFNDNDCQQISNCLSGILKIPSIKKGMTMDVTFTPTNGVKWVLGNFTMLAIVDFENKIMESNEANNMKQIALYLEQVAPERKENEPVPEEINLE